MPAPPQVIHVKRLKRKAAIDDDDDNGGVVDYLRVDTKRQRGDAYIYQRSIQYELDADRSVPRPPRDVVPVIHSSRPGEENVSPGNVVSRNIKPVAAEQLDAKSESAVDEVRHASKPLTPTEPRRFHFSRPLITPKSLLASGLSTGKRSRTNTPATNIFVERGHKRSRTEDVQMKDADSQGTSVARQTDEPPRKLKRPGADRKGPAKPAIQMKKDAPPSIDKHWADNMDEITRNMNDFALHVIGENLAKTEERDRKEAAAAARRQVSSPGTTPQKYKPKPPAKRFAERHPDVAAKQQHLDGPGTADHEDYESASEDDYVVETYVRVPVSSLSEEVDPEKVGLLVFDTEPDVEVFYGEEGDSDDEVLEDDEDENAENYYTADYPDDEVDSDDEYDRMAYHYRTGNASDLEEFDEREGNDDLDSDDENGETRTSASAHLGFKPPKRFMSREGF